MDKEFKDEYDLEFASDDSIPEEELTEDQKKLRDSAGLIAFLASEKNQAINDKRESIEGRLVNSARSYKGVRDKDGQDTLDEQFDSPKVYNRVYHNITRQITNDGVSQLGDLLFPSDDKNYGLNPAPIAEPALALANEPAVDSKGEPLTNAEGQPLTNQQAHNRRVERARRKTKRMFTKLDSALIAASYPSKGRQCIRDAGIYGTGILKAPIPNKISNRWSKKKGGAYGLKGSELLEPDVKVVSPFDFFPDMSATTPEEWGYTWERSYLLPQELQKLSAKQDFDKGAISRVLATPPNSYDSLADEARETAREESFSKNLANSRYELWERRGYLQRKHLLAAGVTLKSKDEYIDCVVWEMNGKPLKVVPSPYEKDDTVYSVFNWDEDPLSVFGYGIPYLASDPQHVYNTAWRMAIDNAGVSTLPQVVIDASQITPADGSNNYDITAGKVWKRSGEIYSAERNDKPFEIFPIKQDIRELFALMDKAENAAYELTGVTRVEKNKQMTDNAPVTLGATQIQQNNSSVTRRSQARRYDDQITATLIARFYNYFMQFEDDDDLKAPMVVEPRGSTILLSKELQANNLMQFFQITQGGTSEGVKTLPLLRAISNSMQHPEGQFLDTDDELQQKAQQAQENPPEPDPMIAMEERKLGVAEADIELRQADMQINAQMEQTKFQLEAEVQAKNFELEYAKLEAKERESMGKTSSEFSKFEMKANLDSQLKQMQEQTKRDSVAAKISADQMKARRAEEFSMSEISIRKQEADRKDVEMSNKMATGQSGV